MDEFFDKNIVYDKNTDLKFGGRVDSGAKF